MDCEEEKLKEVERKGLNRDGQSSKICSQRSTTGDRQERSEAEQE
jgi:hypothetical protein